MLVLKKFQKKKMWKKGVLVFFFLVAIELRHNSAHPAQDLASQHNSNNNNNNNTSESKGGGSFLWQVDTTPPSYFFGTIHVPYTRVWDAIPLNAKKAFARANKIYFEIDLSDHKTLSALSACQLLPKGMHLSQVLPTDLYLRTKLHLDYVKRSMSDWITTDQQDRGLNAEYLFSTITANWERKLPVWVMLMIESLTKSDVASRGVPVLDLYLSQQARRHRKNVGAIEKVEEQCLALNQINSTLVLFALNETLKEQEDIRLGVSKPRMTVDDLIGHYRRGNLDSVLFSTDTMLFPTLNLKSNTGSKEGDTAVLNSHWSEEEQKLAKEFDKIFHEYFLLRRNKQMASRVISLIADNPKTSFFFAFGAGHFVGQNSVLEMMRSAGFTIRQIYAEESLYKHDITGKIHEGHPGLDPGNKNTVQGTFEDLSEEEKTRALLQFLQYHQQQEQESETKRFKEMIQGSQGKEQDDVSTLTPTEIQDEKVVEESLKVWYGISGAGSKSGQSLPLLIFVLFVITTLRRFSTCVTS